MRPGSIEVSGKKKKKKKKKKQETTTRPHRNPRSRTRRFRNDRVHSTPSVGRKGRQFSSIFLYKLFPFYRIMSVNSNYAISTVGLENTLSTRGKAHSSEFRLLTIIMDGKALILCLQHRSAIYNKKDPLQIGFLSLVSPLFK